jgi:PST family polysaccharide transporter
VTATASGGESVGLNWFATERPTKKLGAQAIAFIASRGVLVASTVLVAHAVGIADYGVFALAMVVYQGGLLLRDAGLGQALIVLGRDHPSLAWPAFVGISVVGFALAAAMALLADPITAVLGLPASGQLRILALAFGIGSLGIASNATLERQLRFQARAVVDIVSYSALGGVTVLGLLAGWGVNSLAAGYVAQGILQAIVAIALAPPWTARVPGNAAPIGHLLRYATLLWLGALLTYLATNLDNATVGRLGGSVPLGIYALAYTLGTTLTISPAQVLNRVALPYYARDVRDPGRLRTALDTILPLSASAAVVPAILVMAVAPEIASAIFRQPSAVAPLVILSVFGVVRSAAMGIGTAANGIGLARHATTSAWLNVMIMAVAVPVGFELAGPAGVACAVLVAISASSMVMAWQLVRHAHASLRGLVAPLTLSVVAGLAALLLQDRGSLPLRLGLAAIEIVVAGLLIQSHVQLDWRQSHQPEHSAGA